MVETTSIGPKNKEVQNNQVCLVLDNFPSNKSKYLPLVHSHLIDWGQEDSPNLDWFKNDEAIVEFLGVREGFPYGDHKARFAIELD